MDRYFSFRQLNKKLIMISRVFLSPSDTSLEGKYPSNSDGIHVILDSSALHFSVSLPDLRLPENKEFYFYNIPTTGSGHDVTINTVNGQTINQSATSFIIPSTVTAIFTSDMVNRWVTVDTVKGVSAYSHKVTEDAINGLVKVNGAGVYSAITDNSTNWNTAYTLSHARSHTLLSTSDHSDIATYINQAVLTSSNVNFSSILLGSSTLTANTLFDIYTNHALTVPQFLIRNDGVGDSALSFLADSQYFTIGIDNSVTGNPLRFCAASSINSVIGLSLTNGGQFSVNDTTYIRNNSGVGQMIITDNISLFAANTDGIILSRSVAGADGMLLYNRSTDAASYTYVQVQAGTAYGGFYQYSNNKILNGLYGSTYFYSASADLQFGTAAGSMIMTAAGNIQLGLKTASLTLPNGWSDVAGSRYMMITNPAYATGDMGYFLRQKNNNTTGYDMWYDNHAAGVYMYMDQRATGGATIFRSKTDGTPVTQLTLFDTYALFGTSSANAYGVGIGGVPSSAGVLAGSLFVGTVLSIYQQIVFDQANNGYADGYINYNGYAGGTTQYRGLKIANGKAGYILEMTGAATNLSQFTGKVGVGISPTERMHLYSAGANDPYLLIDSAYNAGASSFGILFNRTYDTGGAGQAAGWIKIPRLGGDLNSGMSFGIGDRGGVSEKMLLNSGGDLLFIGAGTGLPYGGMYMDDKTITVTISAAETYYKIASADVTTGTNLNQMTFASSGLTVLIAGKYLITWSATLKCATANQEVSCAVMINTTAISESEGSAKLTTANDNKCVAGSCVLSLAANDVIYLCCENETGTNNIIVTHLTCSAVMVGG